jgi:GMP synthase (glutamine-hydrolysing)
MGEAMRPDWDTIVARSRIGGPDGLPPRPIATRASTTRTTHSSARRPLGRLMSGHEVLVVQHRGETPSAQLLNALAELGVEPVVRDVASASDLPSPRAVRSVILVGWERVAEAASSGYLNAEANWLRHLDRAGATILGLGYGARVLALAFGGGLRPADRPIRGWGMVDTAIPHVIAAGPWLTWQYDVITLPSRAVVLAHNRLGPQAFRLGRHLGVQFHPEATPATLAEWAARRDRPVDVAAVLGATSRDVTAAAACTRRLLATIVNRTTAAG